MKRLVLLISFVFVAATACTPTGANPTTTAPPGDSGLREVYLPKLGVQGLGDPLFGVVPEKAYSIDSADYPSGAVLSVDWVDLSSGNGGSTPFTGCVELANGTEGPALTSSVCDTFQGIDLDRFTNVDFSTPLLQGQHTYVLRATSPNFICVSNPIGSCGFTVSESAQPRVSW